VVFYSWYFPDDQKRARKCNGESEPVVEQRHVYSLPCKYASPRFETKFVYKCHLFQPEHENAALVEMPDTFDEDKLQSVSWHFRLSTLRSPDVVEYLMRNTVREVASSAISAALHNLCVTT
jgi:hypothetical protein